MSENSEEWQLSGIKKHSIVQFSIIKCKRRETVEETINGLSSEEGLSPNYSHFPRTTHLYKSDLDVLERIMSEIRNNANFRSSDILHSSSDLGLTHKIRAEHRNGAILFFDGLFIRVTRVVTTDRFNLADLLSKTGVPQHEWEIINEFVDCARRIFPDENVSRSYDYYTIDRTDWEKIGLRRQGEAQLRLVINDPKYFTITALIFTKWGKDFHVYLGEEDRTHQMIAHDFFMIQEIETFIDFYGIKSKTIVEHQGKLKTDFGGLMSPIWRVDKKHRMWNSVKETMKSIYAIKDVTEKGKLLSTAIKSLVEKKWAFFNGPRQIWIVGEEQDFEEKIQHPMTHFYEIRLEESKFREIPDSPITPFYQYECQQLDKKVQSVSDQIEEIYQRERDLLTGFQTEFSLYAVWFSLIAIVIAIVSLFVVRF